MELKALGKINLGLDVLGRRENGYHDVRMVMQTVYLYDQIRMEKTKKPGIELLTNLFYLPVNENNLAYQAADLLMKEFHVKEGVKITLDKHIPVAAGMAGGSSNAAAVLFGINRMFSLGLSQKELMERGVTLGADVPYCVMRGTVLAEGIGEILTPLPACPKCHVLIAKPPISVSTKLVYEKLDSHEIENHPDIDGIIDQVSTAALLTWMLTDHGTCSWQRVITTDQVDRICVITLMNVCNVTRNINMCRTECHAWDLLTYIGRTFPFFYMALILICKSFKSFQYLNS